MQRPCTYIKEVIFIAASFGSLVLRSLLEVSS